MAEHDDDDDDIVDVIGEEGGEDEPKGDGLQQILSKYFHPVNVEGYRKCKICENIPSGHRRGAVSVVSFLIDNNKLSERFYNFVFLLESRKIENVQLRAPYRKGSYDNSLCDIHERAGWGDDQAEASEGHEIEIVRQKKFTV